MGDEDRPDLSNTNTIKISKTQQTNSYGVAVKQPLIETNTNDLTDLNIKETSKIEEKIKDKDNNTLERKDFFSTIIVKKGKKHKVTWADKVKKDALTHIVKIESFKNYNLGIQNYNSNNNISSPKDKEEKEETVRCKCLIF